MTRSMEARFFDWFAQIEEYSENTGTPIHQVVNIRESFDQGSYVRKQQIIEELEKFADALADSNALTGQALYDQIRAAIKIVEELK